MQMSPSIRLRSLGALAALATSAVVTTGCSNNAFSSLSSTASPVAASTATLGGKIHGGNQAVGGATVTLYIAGQNGQSATAATLLASTTSSTDGYGAFSFTKVANGTSGANTGNNNTFFCPSNLGVDPFVYVVARGGSTVNGANAAANPDAAFIAPFGPCSTLNGGVFVSMSEVVTVATMAAAHQFMNPSLSSAQNSTTPIENSISADGIFVSTEALTNSLDSIGNVVDLSTGLARTSLVTNGAINGAAGAQVTITPETAKLNQLANIISSCINYAPGTPGTRNPNCSTIYNAAVPPSSTSTTSLKNTSNASFGSANDLLTALYYIFTNLNPGASNVSTLNSLAGTGPYTPTLTAAPTDWSIGVNYLSTSTCTSGGSVLSSPAAISIDQFGDLYIGNTNSTVGTLTQLSHLGVPTSCITLTPVNNTGSSMTGATSTVDIAKNVYSAALTSSDIYRFTPAPNFSAPIDIPTGGPVVAMASDANGNLFYSTSAGNLYEIVGASSGTSFSLSSSVQINGNTTFTPGKSLVIDAAARIWTGGGNSLTGFFPSSTATLGSGAVYSNSTIYTSSSTTTASGILALAVGSSNGSSTPIYSVDGLSNSITQYLVANGSNAVTVNSSFSSSSAGISAPGSVVIDGAGNVWVTNTTVASISAVDSNGNPLTPSTGLQKAATNPGNNALATAIDASGNIWTSSGPNSVTKILGSGVSVYIPYSNALQTNRFQTIP